MLVIQNTQKVNGQEVTIYITVDDVPQTQSIYEDLRESIPERVARKVIKVAHDVFGEGLQLASNCAVRVVESIRDMDEAVRPDEYEVQFGIQLSGEGGASIVKAATEAQLQVSMKWVKKES